MIYHLNELKIPYHDLILIRYSIISFLFLKY
jgi:hypothetical protein